MTTETNTGSELFDADRAEQVADKLNAAADGCTYTAVHDPEDGGASFIEIHDAGGEFVAFAADTHQF